MFGFGHGVAIDDGFLVLGDPAGNPLARRHFQGAEEIIVDAVDIARTQFLILANKENDQVVRNHFFEADCHDGERLAQAQ